MIIIIGRHFASHITCRTNGEKGVNFRFMFHFRYLFKNKNKTKRFQRSSDLRESERRLQATPKSLQTQASTSRCLGQNPWSGS